MDCQSESRAVLLASDHTQKTSYLYLTRCKSWECPYCGRISKLQWVARISQGIDTYKELGIDDWMFVTLTSHPKLRSRDQCLWVGPKAWRKLWSRIHYHYGKVYYVKIPELHKNGRVHWHLIISGGISMAWLKQHVPKTGYGYMVDSQPVISGHNSTLYISKELGKGLSIHNWPRNLRRIRTSQHWPLPSHSDDFSDVALQWHYLCQASAENIVFVKDEVIERTGHTVTLLNES